MPKIDIRIMEVVLGCRVMFFFPVYFVDSFPDSFPGNGSPVRIVSFFSMTIGV